MAEPPFHMPGHRWDPEKKRFFKILPGQPPPDSSNASEASSSRSGRKGVGRFKGKNKHEHISAADLFTVQPRWPAFYIPNPAPKSSCKRRSAFAQTTSDPVTLRQQGRTPLNSTQRRAQHRIQAMYSHLSLCGARRLTLESPYVGIQTAADGYSLLLLSTTSRVVRLSPIHYFPQLVVDQLSQGVVSTFMSRDSRGLWYGMFDANGKQRGVQYLTQPPHAQDSFPPRLISEYFPLDQSAFTAVSFRIRPTMTSNGATSWAFREIMASHTGTRTSNRNGRLQDRDGPRRTVLYAASTAKRIHIFSFDSPPHGQADQQESNASKSLDSDVMAIAFSFDGQVLYCGTRSGLVLAWRWKWHEEPTSILLAGEGSVTNLQAVSSEELLVVRINGQVQLLDTAIGQVKCHFQGHVNSYHFRLGLAIDTELRLLALAGLDRRVRVWSLDSPLPLGTSLTTLPHVYHPPRGHPGRENEHFYRVDTETNEYGHDFFLQDYPTLDGTNRPIRGSTLSSVVFPKDVDALHWHPRYPFEGCELSQVRALREEGGADYQPPQLPWKDLVVTAGQWMYHFRWP